MSPRVVSTTSVRRAAAVQAPAGRRRAQGRTEVFRAELTGFEEVPPVLTPARGSFRAQLAADGGSLDFELTFTDLTSQSTAAHIHLGQPRVNGPVAVFLCGGDAGPECPGMGGTVRGTITSDDVLSVPEQGLVAGDLAGLVRLMRAGVTYVNVHSTMFPGGEIRGQLHRVPR